MTVKTEERHAQLELCTPYVFGRLNPGNRKQFEAHLAAGCELCRVELSGLYEATALLPLLLRQEAPPSGVRQTLLNKISSIKPEPQPSEPPRQQSERTPPERGERSQQRRGERSQQQRGERSQPPRGERPQQQRGERSQQQRNERPQQQREKPATPSLRPERPWYLYASIVIGVLLIVALIIFVNQLVGTAGSQEKKISELQNELRQVQGAVGILQAERVEILSLASLVPGTAMYGKVLWDPAKRNALLQTANLPAQPEGKQYQFWILKEKKVYSVGVFDITAEKSNTMNLMPLRVSDTKEIEGFSVTLEPKGGSPQPTGAIQLRVVVK